MAEDFIFCGNSGSVNKRLNECVKRCVEGLVKSDAIKPLSIVLTGSLSRGEGSLIEQGDILSVLSDMEFFIVIDDRTDSSAALKTSREAESSARKELLGLGVDCKVEFVPAFKRYFSNVKPSIFAYELRQHGKVLWGQDILGDIPLFSVCDMPRLDAFYLLCNRIVEQLDAHVGLDAGRITIEQFIYAITKFYLDLATSILTFEGKYVSTYANRATALRFLDLPRRLGCRSLAGLVDKVDFWTRFKLRPSKDVLRGIDRAAALKAWQELAGYAARVWLWELKELLGTEEEDILKLGERFVKELGPKGRKAKGLQWLKFGYRALRGNRLRDLVSARYMAGDPRHMLYMEAALLYFSMSGLTGEGEGEAHQANGFLPVRTGSAGGEKLARELVRIWTIYFRNN